MINKKVLIIEDDESLQRALSDKLKIHDITPVSVSDAKAALRKVMTEKPDLIILDIMLPGGMNGFDVLEALKRNPDSKPIPVIVLTNLDGEEASAKQIGAADYIVKANIEVDVLVERIKNMLKP